MRFSPTKLLHGLLYAAPVILLTLVACGGGGSTPTAPIAAYYYVGGAISGVPGTGLILRNNGGDDLAVASGAASYVFSTPIVSTGSYNVTVLSHPNSPPQRCSVVSASGPMIVGGITNADVTCVPAFTIGVTLSSLTGGAVVLQNNGGNNLLLSANGTFTFSTPLENSATYDVAVLSQPNSPAQLCTPTSTLGTVLNANVNVSISCSPDLTPPSDRFVYTANFGSASVSAYAIDPASAVLSSSFGGNAGSGPSSVAVDAASHVYVTNQGGNSISAFDITNAVGDLAVITDVDAGTTGTQSVIATGPTPVAIAIHPSGRFAYVVNSGSGSAADTNSVSAYSIDAATGALARIDTDGAIAGTQYFIKAKVTPVSIAIDPAGAHAYVTNFDSGNLSVYGIDATTGALDEIQTPVNTGTDPYSITVDPAGTYAYVTSWNTDMVYIFPINSDGTLSTTPSTVLTGTGPRAVTIDPSGTHAYVVNSSSNDISAYNIIGGGALSQIDCAGGGYTGCNSSPNTKNFLAGTNPISISIDSSGQYAYVANSGGTGTVSAYGIAGTGALNMVDTYATGLSPYSVITAK